MFVVGLLSGIILTGLIGYLVVPKLMFIESKSRFEFDETAELIVGETAKANWSMPYQYDLQATMKKHGFDVNPVKVFSVCKPDLANQILGSNHELFVSSLMPCRLAVYQKEDGKTYISRMNAGLVSKLLGNKIRKVMTLASAENEKILEPIIQK